MAKRAASPKAARPTLRRASAPAKRTNSRGKGAAAPQAPSPAARPTRPPAAPDKPPAAPPAPIYVLSDSTGNLGRHVLTAILTQFPPAAFTLETRGFLREPRQIAAVLEQVARRPGMVFHGMLDPQHKRLIADGCEKIGVGSCDLTGPFVRFIAEHSGLTPGRNHDLLHHVDEAYQRRIRALEFTLEHDDSLGLQSLSEADIVLVGVSRTSKTPTSIYLAQLGYRVANVSLAPQVQPPRELLELGQPKVVGLAIEPRVLAEIRHRRGQQWRMDAGDRYTDPREVAKEIAWVRDLFRRQGWPVIDVTNQAVEETAAKIVHTLGVAPSAAPASAHP
ncbi:MAG TPA: pyruvate, water dikinase regulatory protein [Tepidisphaeraceae bacterium]|nr:pyruvate, water dikinase regulatory protein [Tepidisphaeraceae bacterium]